MKKSLKKKKPFTFFLLLLSFGPKLISQKCPENVLDSFHRIFFLITDVFSHYFKAGAFGRFLEMALENSEKMIIKKSKPAALLSVQRRPCWRHSSLQNAGPITYPKGPHLWVQICALKHLQSVSALLTSSSQVLLECDRWH